MKLSEAIRLGAMMKPQDFSNGGRTTNSTCAREAAADAVGENDWFEACRRQEWQWTYAVKIVCPVCRGYERALACVIAYCLNDLHKWSRERIADFVEQIENQQNVPKFPLLAETAELTADND